MRPTRCLGTLLSWDWVNLGPKFCLCLVACGIVEPCPEPPCGGIISISVVDAEGKRVDLSEAAVVGSDGSRIDLSCDGVDAEATGAFFALGSGCYFGQLTVGLRTSGPELLDIHVTTDRGETYSATVSPQYVDFRPEEHRCSEVCQTGQGELRFE
ncbi:MAG: hypothetical protein KTR25_13075 [Myxococcales bacterium]|nr:hypothetical protein [Myxococcales bacterium]